MHGDVILLEIRAYSATGSADNILDAAGKTNSQALMKGYFPHDSSVENE
jgi:hypothetical protein